MLFNMLMAFVFHFFTPERTVRLLDCELLRTGTEVLLTFDDCEVDESDSDAGTFILNK